MINVIKENVTLTDIDSESEEINYRNLTQQIANKLASIFNWDVLANYSGSDPEVIDTYFGSNVKETMYGVSLIGLEDNTYCIGVSISSNKILNLFISETPRINTDVMTKYTNTTYCTSLIAINCRCGKYVLGNNVSCNLSDYSVEITYFTGDKYTMLKLATSATPTTEYSITYDKQADCLLMLNSKYYTLWYLKETYIDATPWLLEDTPSNLESKDKGSHNSFYTWSRKYNTYDLLRYAYEFIMDVSDFSIKTIFQWHLLNYCETTSISFGHTTKNSVPIHQLFGLFPKLGISQVYVRKLYAPLTDIESNIYLGIYSGNTISSNTTIKVNDEYFYIIKAKDCMFYAIKLS